jgi:hypothetical protein
MSYHLTTTVIESLQQDKAFIKLDATIQQLILEKLNTLIGTQGSNRANFAKTLNLNIA